MKAIVSTNIQALVTEIQTHIANTAAETKAASDVFVDHARIADDVSGVFDSIMDATNQMDSMNRQLLKALQAFVEGKDNIWNSFNSMFESSTLCMTCSQETEEIAGEQAERLGGLESWSAELETLSHQLEENLKLFQV